MVVSITALVFFNFCSEKQVSEPNSLKEKVSLSKVNSDTSKINLSINADSTLTDSSKVKDKNKDKGKDSTKIKDGIIQPMAQSSCLKDVTYWVFENMLKYLEKLLVLGLHMKDGVMLIG